MASTTCLTSFSSSASPFIGSKVSTNQSHSPPPSRVSFRPLRVSAACASTAERPTSYIATPTSASSLYEVLGIQMGATCQEIKTAYRRLARIFHPDVAANGQGEDTAYEFMRVHEAYETLSDPEKRADYDLSLYRRGRQMGSPFVMSAATVTTMATGFSGYTSQRWETDQCWYSDLKCPIPLLLKWKRKKMEQFQKAKAKARTVIQRQRLCLTEISNTQKEAQVVRLARNLAFESMAPLSTCRCLAFGCNRTEMGQDQTSFPDAVSPNVDEMAATSTRIRLNKHTAQS
ncbi:hypothetical protein POTOM_009342 [Populus tomentosa]|uniref:J domain-containing protein n=1 Tax=Populus tomentosa TaxID=118781 RepID=A0A8X8DBP3_POPTO|nr:hypothetical protein POTOM_009342 [Populus tomentosa]